MRTLVAKEAQFNSNDLVTIDYIQSLDDYELLNLLSLLSNPSSAAQILKELCDSATDLVTRGYATYDLVREVLVERGVIEVTLQ